jgi:hypothetical protein
VLIAGQEAKTRIQHHITPNRPRSPPFSGFCSLTHAHAPNLSRSVLLPCALTTALTPSPTQVLARHPNLQCSYRTQTALTVLHTQPLPSPPQKFPKSLSSSLLLLVSIHLQPRDDSSLILRFPPSLARCLCSSSSPSSRFLLQKNHLPASDFARRLPTTVPFH